MNTDDKSIVVIDIIGGLRPLSDVSLVGIDISITESKDTTSFRREWRFGCYHDLRVEVSCRTMAKGMLRLMASGGDIPAWASFILAAPFIVVSEDDEQDDLLQVIWNASFGYQPTEEELAQVANCAQLLSH